MYSRQDLKNILLQYERELEIAKAKIKQYQAQEMYLLARLKKVEAEKTDEK